MSTTTRPRQDATSTLTATIVDRVTDREGVGPLEVPPLYESIDPEAVAGLVDTGDGVEYVTFSYCGYEITVEGLESVRVTTPEDD
jgi:hypothetical protein